MFPYAAVEPILVAFFQIRGDQRLAFRARLRNLQRVGFGKAAPGRGKRLTYSIFDICDLALALSLADFGMTPSSIVMFVFAGEFEKQHVKTPFDGGNPIYFFLNPAEFSGGSIRHGFAYAHQVLTRAVIDMRTAVVNASALYKEIDRLSKGLSDERP